jgi:hypothetical protein
MERRLALTWERMKMMMKKKMVRKIMMRMLKKR